MILATGCKYLIAEQVTVPPMSHPHAEFCIFTDIPSAEVFVVINVLTEDRSRVVKIKIRIFVKGVEKQGIAVNKLEYGLGRQGLGAGFLLKRFNTGRPAAGKKNKTTQEREIFHLHDLVC